MRSVLSSVTAAQLDRNQAVSAGQIGKHPDGGGWKCGTRLVHRSRTLLRADFEEHNCVRSQNRPELAEQPSEMLEPIGTAIQRQRRLAPGDGQMIE
jgi:hypothetical protein